MRILVCLLALVSPTAALAEQAHLNQARTARLGGTERGAGAPRVTAGVRGEAPSH